jgi:hypothetical protein
MGARPGSMRAERAHDAAAAFARRGRQVPSGGSWGLEPCGEQRSTPCAACAGYVLSWAGRLASGSIRVDR